MREDNKDGSPPSRSIKGLDSEQSAASVDATSGFGHGAASSKPVDVEDSGGSQLVSPNMDQLIGRHLRAVYDDVAKQPIPDRFLELMRQLDSKTQAG